MWAIFVTLIKHMLIVGINQTTCTGRCVGAFPMSVHVQKSYKTS